MPELPMEGTTGDTGNGEAVPRKDIFVERSPRSPLSSRSRDTDSIDLAIDGAVDTSIEELYNNIYEMQSSDVSPSRRSYLSYGEESRIDSELRFLAGVDYGEEEDRREEEDEESNEASNGDKVAKVGPESPTSSKSVLQPEPKGPPRSRLGSESSPNPTPRSKSMQNRIPKRRQGEKSLRKLNAVSSFKKGLKLQNGVGGSSDARYLGSYLLKQARDILSSGDNHQKALEVALRAIKSFENAGLSKPNLDFVVCLHFVASLYCRQRRYKEAIPILERSIEIPVMDLGENHSLAKFAGCMQLGDTYAMLGQIDNSLEYYKAGLEIQRQVLGEKDNRLGDTCRYLAEAHVQAMQFDEAERLCQMALDIHKENRPPASLEEAADRRLLGLICDSKGDYESSLEHYVLASMALAAAGHEMDVASIDCNIGDAYLALARYDEAICSYQKALTTFKSSRGENHPSVASVFVRLADLYNRIGKFRESKSYCENALRIYSKPVPGSAPEEIASGLVDISAIYESMDEPEQALKLLQKAVKAYENAPGQQSTIAGIEAQMGVLYYMLGSYTDAYDTLQNAVTKFRAIGEKKSALFGIALNQLGLVCVQLYAINEAADCFEEARSILEAEFGPYHADTIGVYSNLAGTYDAMSRTDDAIEIMEFVIEMREVKLGTANPDVDEEKRRLGELLKEAGRVRRRKSMSLETLLVTNSHTTVGQH